MTDSGTVDVLLGGLSGVHRAACSCGWTGETRTRHVDAERDLVDHYQADHRDEAQ